MSHFASTSRAPAAVCRGHRSAPAAPQELPDRFFGQKDLAEFCEHVVSSLFVPRHLPRPGIDTPPLSPPTAGPSALRKDPPALVEFIAYALYRTRLPVAISHQALFLLKRLKLRYPSARGTASSPHRLFLSALMLSSKLWMDDTYSNKSWAIVGGNYFPLREINQMERELFAFLDYNVVVHAEELALFVHDAELDWHLATVRRQAPPAPASDGGEGRKRRRSDTLLTQESVHREEALRHKRAADAAIALLRPSLSQAAHYRTARPVRGPPVFSSTSSSSSTSPATPSFRHSGASSACSSATTSPELSTPCSPLSMHDSVPDIADACDRFNGWSVSGKAKRPELSAAPAIVVPCA